MLEEPRRIQSSVGSKAWPPVWNSRDVESWPSHRMERGIITSSGAGEVEVAWEERQFRRLSRESIRENPAARGRGLSTGV